MRQLSVFFHCDTLLSLFSQAWWAALAYTMPAINYCMDSWREIYFYSDNHSCWSYDKEVVIAISKSQNKEAIIQHQKLFSYACIRWITLFHSIGTISIYRAWGDVLLCSARLRYSYRTATYSGADPGFSKGGVLNLHSGGGGWDAFRCGHICMARHYFTNFS